MPGRGHQTFKKRQKEQQRKDRQQAKMEKRLQRKTENEGREGSGPEMGEAIDLDELVGPDDAVEQIAQRQHGAS